MLGHHPLSWLIQTQQAPIKSLLGKHSVLYLHGHLHDAWAEPTYGGGSQFLAIQTGAAFQAREGEKWRNGLVWGEADFAAQEVRLQPLHWVPNQQEWVLVTDAFHENHRQGDWWTYALPGTERARGLVNSAPLAGAGPPRGWAVATPDDLRRCEVPLDEQAAVGYFNGAVPEWRTALSTSIPRREVVGTLAAEFLGADATRRPIVTLLLAAACEGKTTAVLQAADLVVQRSPGWRILRRMDDAEPFDPAALLPVLDPAYHWLVVLDEADRVAEALIRFLRQIPQTLRGRLHFLLACRDSDWQASRAATWNWSDVCTLRLIRLDGLGEADAEAIVKAWTAFGPRGLGDLAATPEEERAATLGKQATEEAKTSTGAFFGALLAVRHGSDLPEHARLMLERLGQRPIPSGGTLRDALAFIAAMHAEGLEFLSRPVLAEALGCPYGKLHRDVLTPLGQEAAATLTSAFIFTRHRRIAKALLDVLEKVFAEDVDGRYLALVKAAIEVVKSGARLLENPAVWRFDIAEHFFAAGRRELALDIANAVYQTQPSNRESIVNLAKLYRRAGVPEQALKLFRDLSLSKHLLPRDFHRGFYLEWATAQALVGERTAGTLLAAFSLSDDCPVGRVSNQDAVVALSGLCDNFEGLFDRYHTSAFNKARVATATLAKQLHLDARAAAHFRQHLIGAAPVRAAELSVEDAFELFSQGVAEAEATGINDDAIERIVPDAAHLGFGDLKRLIYDAAEAK